METLFYATLVLMALVIMTTLYLMAIRFTYTVNRNRLARVESSWSLIFQFELLETPRIKKRDWPVVLELWTKYRSKSRSPESEKLNAIAIKIGLHRTIYRILRPSSFVLFKRPVWETMLALTAAQWISDDGIEKYVWVALGSRNRNIALRACTTLVRTQAKNFEKAVIRTLFRFSELAPAITIQIGAAGGGKILLLLQPFLDRLPNYTIKNFIALAERSSDPALLPMVIEKLHQSRDNEEAGSLLRAVGNLGGPKEKSIVIPFLEHETTFLRIQAANALGKLGDIEDIPLIIPLLKNKDWWFRYRAAKAIVKLADKDYQFLEVLSTTLNDKNAAETLHHVMIEKQWMTA